MKITKKRKKELKNKMDNLYEACLVAENIKEELINEWCRIETGKDFEELFNDATVFFSDSLIKNAEKYKDFDEQKELIGFVTPANLSSEIVGDFRDFIINEKYGGDDYFPLSNEDGSFDSYGLASYTENAETITHCFSQRLNQLCPEFDYYSKDFRILRHKVFIKKGEICALCGAIPKEGISLTIDHIKPVSKYPELAMIEDNLQVLCWPCNQKKSDKVGTHE